MAMIEAKKLMKVFGPIVAAKDVSFSVDKGEALGFLGPNGAGKSTVMRMLTCFLTPTSGTALVNGHDILTDSMQARRIVGYLPESNPVYSDMTAQSFLSFIGEMRGYKGQELKTRVDAVLETCWLTDVRHQSVDTLSKGYRRRVGLAQALIHDPPILILDEPTDGLDPNQKHEVRTLIKQMTAEKCIVISTHILEEVDAVCTRAIIFAHGQIVADETPEELKQRSRYHGAMRLAVRGDGDEIRKRVFEGLPGVKEVKEIRADGPLARFTIFPEKGKAISEEVLSLTRKRGWKVEEVSIEGGHLDEVFREITLKGGKRS